MGRRVVDRGQYRGWNVPSSYTLSLYGGTVEKWEAILDRQQGVCAICETVPTTGRGEMDHEHVPGWRALAPEERWSHVRGILCMRCNKFYMVRGITPERAANIVKYLTSHRYRQGRA